MKFKLSEYGKEYSSQLMPQLEKILADGEWHNLCEFILLASHELPPELPSRAIDWGRKKPSLDVKVSEGTQAIVEYALEQLLHAEMKPGQSKLEAPWYRMARADGKI